MDEYRYLVSIGHVSSNNSDIKNPAIDWLDNNTWKRVLALENLEVFNIFTLILKIIVIFIMLHWYIA